MKQLLNWDIDIKWKTGEYPDQDYVMVMDEFFLSDDQSYNGERMMDVTQFKYSYKEMDIQAAARDKSGDRSNFVKEYDVEVYETQQYGLKTSIIHIMFLCIMITLFMKHLIITQSLE